MDYREVGLMAGLEVHQQLFTERKLFCHCPAGLYTRSHDAEVFRHMRPTLSELGEYDGTALMEFKTKKNIVYLLHKDNVCTYEMDDTPPFLINQKAVDIAIEQCLMLGCDIVDELHIARKQYLDGSIPTGFQRTAVVGINGRLPFRDRELSIVQVTVEEDSCREVSDLGHLIVWRTDRLGMPLIETVTGPELHTPAEVEEAILLIGRVCRSTGHVRVGLGASRQDVNVSVRGGRRVEIKGVPKAGWAPKLVHGEAVRQVNLLGLRDELRRRGMRSPEDIQVRSAVVTDLFAKTELIFLHREQWRRWVRDSGRRPGFELGEGDFEVRAVRLIGLAGTLSWPTQPEHTFAHELIGRVRVIAGLDQQPPLIHSEKWPEHHGSRRELRMVKRRLRCDAKDALVLVWGPRDDTLMAEQEIRLRYVDAVDGVPNETRQPYADGSTDFERILPGPDRMYPDTDSPPTRIDRARVAALQQSLPSRPWQREARYAAAKVPQSTIYYLIRRGGANGVDRVAAAGFKDLRKICEYFGEMLKGLRRRGVPVDAMSVEEHLQWFSHAQEMPVLWQTWPQVITELAHHPERTVAEIVTRDRLGQPPEAWREMVQDICGQAHSRCHNSADTAKLERFAIGKAMEKLRGKVDAREVAAALREALGAND